jgi:C-terminal processing protease CtpA/Prc
MFGLGFTYDLDPQTHLLRITKVYPKSPAAIAGLSAGFIIKTVGGVSTESKSLAECGTLLRANGSPTVHLEFVNPERKETNAVEITRGKFLNLG